MLKKIIEKFNAISENNRIVVVNVAGAFAVKGLAMVVSLFTMPAYIRFFGNETTLGLWFTMVSVLNWVLNFDMGIGNGLRNHLTKSIVKKDTENARRYMTSAYISVGAIGLGLFVLLFCVFGLINWNMVFNIKESVVSSSALLLSVRIVFSGIILQMFFRLISSVLYAIQRSFINNLLQLFVVLTTLLLVVVTPSKSNDENLIAMAVVHSVAGILPPLVTTLIVFSGKNMRKIIPKASYFSFTHAKEVISLGGAFLGVQIAYMIIMNSNEYLITLFRGNEEVVEFQVYNRLFTLIGTIFALTLTPVWSAVTKAAAEKNIRWIKSLYKRFMVLGGIFCAFEFILAAILQFVVDLWLREDSIRVNTGYAIVFALMGSTMVICSVYANISNGLGLHKTQLVCYGIGALAKPFVAWVLVSFTGSWIGLIIANIMATLPYCVIQAIIFSKYFKKEVS